jgi:hypothetical protein
MTKPKEQELKPCDYCNVLPRNRRTAPAPQWTTESPTAPGYYWITFQIHGIHYQEIAKISTHK